MNQMLGKTRGIVKSLQAKGSLLLPETLKGQHGGIRAVIVALETEREIANIDLESAVGVLPGSFVTITISLDAQE